jgi:hypothetical protein
MVVRQNGKDYAGISSFMLTGELSTIGMMLSVGLAVLVVVGAVALRKRAPALSLSLAATIAVIVIWPFSQSRFLVPVFPFAGLVAAYGIERALAARPRAVRVVVLGALVLLVSALEIGQPIAPAGVYSAFGPTFIARGREVASWIERNTPPDARILVDRGSLIYLRTGRRTSVAWPEQPEVRARSVFEPPGRYHAQRIVADSVDYIVAWGPKGRQTHAHLVHIEERCPGTVVQLPPVPAADMRVPSSFYRVDRARMQCLAATAF